MIRRPSGQTSFFEDMVYDRVLRNTRHWLLDLSQVVDFEQFRPILEEPYTEDRGRPTDPVRLFKVVFLQFVANLSDRKVQEAVQLNLLYKYFVGLPADGEAPDYSTISKFRTKIGPERFQRIFNEVVRLARGKGVVSNKLRLVDATHVRARVDLFGPHKKKKNKSKGSGKGPTLPGSPDPDATFGHKSATKPFYGYKTHIGTDADSGIITDLRVTPGNYDDGSELPWLICHDPPEAVCADKGYDYRNNHNHCKQLGIIDGIIRKGNKTQPPKAITRQRYKVERTFAEMKQWHGLARARWWGLAKMAIQAAMTAMVVNCKRMVRQVSEEELRLKVA